MTTAFDQLRSLLQPLPPSVIVRDIAPLVHGRAQLIVLIAAWQTGSGEHWCEILDLGDRVMDGLCAGILTTMHEQGYTILAEH